MVRCRRAALLALLLFARGADGVLTLHSLEALYPDAVCADGSPAGYYWEAATAPEGASTWILHLESGGWCHDEVSCRERCRATPSRCSSTSWNATWRNAGILSDSYPEGDPRLRSANKAFLRYCTSDAHMADGEAFGLQFRGARVVRAVLADLVRRGLGRGADGVRDLLVFGGNSAGSRGAMVHLDYVPEMLGSAAAPYVKVVGFLDSPLWVDMDPSEASGPGSANGTRSGSLKRQTQRFFSYANVSHLDQACAASFPGKLGWKCIFGQYRLQYLRTRSLVVEALEDSFQLQYMLPPSSPAGLLSAADRAHVVAWNKEQRTFVSGFARRIARVISQLSPHHVVLAPGCLSHAESLSDEGFFLHAGSNGMTMNQALQYVLNLTARTEAPQPPPWIDACEGVDCSRYCRRRARDWGAGLAALAAAGPPHDGAAPPAAASPAGPAPRRALRGWAAGE